MKSTNMNVDTGNKSWITPRSILAPLLEFDLDPCCPPTMPWKTARQMVHYPDDGLKVEWNGKRVWLNPPYGQASVPFLEKMAKHDGGGIALLFGRTDTRAWHELVFPYAKGFLFMKGRIKFCSEDGNIAGGAPAPSILVAYSYDDLFILSRSGIAGKVI